MRLSLFVTFIVSLIPLLNSWYGYAWFSGYWTEIWMEGGFMPGSDSSWYFQSAWQILTRGDLADTNLFRPFSAIVPAIAMMLGDYSVQSVQLFHLFFATLGGGLVLWLAYTHGGLVAVWTGGIIHVVFLWLFLPTLLTEPVGFYLGCFATCFLWVGFMREKPVTIAIGLAMLAIAIHVRSGPQFVLPLLALYGGWVFKSWRWGGIFFVVIFATTFFFNHGLLTLYGLSTESSQSNFSFTLYGVVSGGKGWVYAQEIFGKAPAKEIYQASFQLMMEKPWLTVMGILKNWLAIFTAPGRIFNPDILKITANLVWIVVFIIAMMAFVAMKKQNKKAFHLLTVVYFGMFLSAGFVFMDGTPRVFATTVPFLSLGIGLTVAQFFAPIPKKQGKYFLTFAFIPFAFILLMAIALPYLQKPFPIPFGKCPIGQIPIAIPMPHKMPQSVLKPRARVYDMLARESIKVTPPDDGFKPALTTLYCGKLDGELYKLAPANE